MKSDPLSIYGSNPMGIGQVVAVSSGRISQVRIQSETHPVAGQADHVRFGYLADTVIVTWIDHACYVLAKLLTRDQFPAFYGQQLSSTQGLFRTGMSHLYLNTDGGVIFGNPNASVHLDKSGSVQLQSQAFIVNSYREINLHTQTGSIDCRYPETQG